MATNKNILLVAVSHDYQLKIQFVAKIYGKVYIFYKKCWIKFFPQENVYRTNIGSRVP